MPIGANDLFGDQNNAGAAPNPAPSPTRTAGGISSAADLFGGQPSDEAPSAPVLNAPSSAKEPASFMEGMAYGGKEAFNPFNVDKGEQARATSSGPALAGYLLGNIAASLAGNAALTAATGGAAGAVGLARQANTAKNIASVLWAAYQGLGRDRIRTRDEGRSWKPMDGGRSTASALLSVGLEANPLFKAGDKLSAVLRTGAQAAGEGARELIHGEDAKTAGVAAALGIVGAGIPLYQSLALPKGGTVEKVVKDVAELTLDDALETRTPELYTNIQKKMAELEKARPDFSKAEALASVPTEFKRTVVGDLKAKLDEEALDKAFNLRANRLGAKKLDEKWTLMSAQKAFGDATGEALEEQMKEFGVPMQEPGFIKRLFLPMFYISREVDRVTGLDTAKLVDKVTQAHNYHNSIADKFAKRFAVLKKEADKMGLSGQDVTDLITMEDMDAYKRVVSKMGGEEVAEAFRRRFSEEMSGDKGLLGYLKELGYSPAMRQNYLSMKAVSSPQIASILQGQVERLPAALDGRSLRDVRLSLEKASATQGGLEALKKQDEAARIVDLLDKTSNRLGLTPMDDVAKFGEMKDRLLNGARWAEQADGIPDDLTEMSALFARKGEVPGEIRERDAWKLVGSYINENLRAAHFEDALEYGKLYVDSLKKLGLQKNAQLFEDYLKDQAGGARHLASLMRKLSTKLEFQGAEMVRKAVETGGDKRLGQAIGALPEFTSWLNNQVYTSKLALNVPGIIRNTTQFMATTIPELGASGVYGTKKALAASRRILSQDKKAKAAFSKSVQEMEAKGLLSNHSRLETSEFSKAFGGVKGKIDSFNEKLFTMYQATDKFNRVLTWNMGKEVAADIISGNKDAIKFVDSLDSATKQHLKKALSRGDGPEKLEAVQDIVGRYLISKTQFDYSMANKAEWARAVGPAFSMFSTWPGMVAGDIVNTVSEKGALQGGKKILTKFLPFYAAALAAQSYVESSRKDMKKITGVDTSGATKYLFGDTTSYSPLDAVIPSKSPDAGRGGLLSNPLLRFSTRLGSDIGTMNFKDAGATALKEGATTYLPGVAPFLNELDRYHRITTGKKLTTKMAKELGLKNKESK